MARYEADIILFLAACGVWQVQTWLQIVLVRFQRWFEKRYVGESGRPVMEPVTFESLKERWRFYSRPRMASPNGNQCADELELLEKRVHNEIVALPSFWHEGNQCVKLFDVLTALLGGQ